MLGRADADDATQDVFLRAWQRLASFRNEAAFGTWLQRLALNVLLRQREAAARPLRRTDDLDEAAVPARDRPPEDAMDVETALGRLDGAHRAVVVLHDMEGYQHDEIAAMLGISASASKMRLSRARAALRAHVHPPDRLT